MIKKWLTTARHTFASTPIFGIDRVTRRAEPDSTDADFFVINVANWVNIFAQTPDGHVVAIRQYRQGTDQVTIEVPGGGVDADEAPINAAKRELREETGYTSSEWIHVGSVDVNPAIQNNKCHIFVAVNARQTEPTDFDEHEDIEVLELEFSEFFSKIDLGEIAHSLVVAGAYLARPYLQGA